MSGEGQAARAKRELARELGIDESEIAVKSVTAKEWPDASLGVREPGQMYAQMLTSGYMIELEAKGKTYRYHSDEQSRVVRAR